MERKRFGGMLALCLAVCFFFISSDCAIAKGIKWRAVTTWTPAITLIKSDQHLVDIINEICKDEVEIKLFPAGEIVSSFEVFGAVQSGTVQAGFDWPGYWAGKNTAFAVLGALPMGPYQMDYLTWIYGGGGDAMAMEVYGKYGMKYFFHNILSAESGLRGSKAYTKLSDFKGAKIRMSGMFQGQILKDLGAAQVMLAGQEIYQALEKGVIDAAEFSSPDNDWALGFQEITKIWSVPGWHQSGTAAGIMINNKAWDALPKHVQAKIKWAAMANIIWSAAHFNMESGIYTKKFMDKGVKVVHMDDESIAEIQKLSYKHILEEANKNPLFAKVALSMYECLKTLSYYRDKEWPALKRQVPIHLPDMEALKAAAAKYK